jgi:hypothetical protein
MTLEYTFGLDIPSNRMILNLAYSVEGGKHRLFEMTVIGFQGLVDVMGAVLMGEHRFYFVGVSGALDGYCFQSGLRGALSNG